MRYTFRLPARTSGQRIDTQESDSLKTEKDGKYFMDFTGQHEVEGLELGERTRFRVWYDPVRQMISWKQSPKSLAPDYRDVLDAFWFFLKKLDKDEKTSNFKYADGPSVSVYIDEEKKNTVATMQIENSTIAVNHAKQLVSPYINWFGQYLVARATLPDLLEAIEDYLGGDES